MTTMTEPANAASMALLSPEGFLLIRRARSPFRELWTLPGGRCEPGETPRACASRELREETGLTVSGCRHVMTSDIGHGYVLAVFAAFSEGGTVVGNDEILSWNWLPPDATDRLQTTPNLKAVLMAAERLLTGR